MFQITGATIFCRPEMQITWFAQFFLILCVFQKPLAKKQKNGNFRQKNAITSYLCIFGIIFRNFLRRIQFSKKI